MLVLGVPQAQAAAIGSCSISEIQKGGDVTGLACERSGNNSGLWSHLFASVNTDEFSRDFVLSRNICLNILYKNQVYIENAVCQ